LSTNKKYREEGNYGQQISFISVTHTCAAPLTLPLTLITTPPPLVQAGVSEIKKPKPSQAEENLFPPLKLLFTKISYL